MASDEKKLISDTDKVLLLGLLILGGWLMMQLSSVLTPFFIATLLAYLGDPLVDRLEKTRLSRTVSVCLVFAIFVLSGLLLLLIFIPLLSAQLASLFEKLPTYLDQLQKFTEPVLQSVGLSADMLDFNTLKTALKNYWAEAGKVATDVMSYMTRSGIAVLQWLTNLVLVPVLTFYLLRDWDDLVARVRALLPRKHADNITQITIECDDMLAGFLRGQLMVMLALSIIYSIGLTVIGLDLALLLGVIAGVVSFVPYLGLVVGITLAGLAAYLQFQEWLPVLMVFLVFGFAQAIESMILTPRFVGERIGLHPVAVIFAVMAGATLFGFTGVLLALPVAAVVMVLLRHAHHRYLNSELYS